MRILVISDIHGNYPALEAVLQDAGQVDQTWCLGDVVGYGPFPNECIQALKGLPELTCLMGNHDAAVIGAIPLHTFNQEARLSVQWTRATLSPANKFWLESLPDSQIQGDFTLAHGSPRNPIWEYLLDPSAAAHNFSFFDTYYCLVGHTHLPIIFFTPPGKPTNWAIPQADQIIKLKPRAILNPGSVGQPRDHDPRAAYAILDTELPTWHLRRVLYDVERVQQGILNASLPERHALRLRDGW
jgi:diadenosine tetraphosphatase ApaH/serine/threonine PP2A family protein phosphatase